MKHYLKENPYGVLMTHNEQRLLLNGNPYGLYECSVGAVFQ
jgi:hypothetical protein